MSSTDVLEDWQTEIKICDVILAVIPDSAPPYCVCIAELASALRAERRRVKELEADAKLGRMVREMPAEHHLIHTVYGDWWYGRNVRGEFGATGPTPEAALEAARKEAT